MTDYALDYSAGAPNATAVRTAGYVGVIRYVGFPANRKCITRAEYADMLAHGVGVGLVFEQFAADALQAAPGGRRNAALAKAHAADVGFPPGRPIYMACDTDIVSAAQFASVLDYLRGAGEILGGPQMVGVYGEYDVIDRAAAAGVAAWFWQTRAWSAGKRHPRRHLTQELGQVAVDGIDCDRNTIVVPDWGQAGAGAPRPLEDELPFTPQQLQDAAYAAIDQWAAEHHSPPQPSLNEMIYASDNHFRQSQANGAGISNLAATLATVAGQVAAQADDEAKILAAVQGVLAAGGATESRLIAAIKAVPSAPGGGVDAAAVVAALRDTLIAGTAGPA